MRRFLMVVTGLWLALAGNVPAQDICDGRDLIADLAGPERQAVMHEADAMPHPEGLLWQATRDGLELTLFGTYHFAHRLTGAHLAALEPLVAASDQVLLEMSPDDRGRLQTALAEDPSLLFITSGPALPDLLGEADWQRFSAEMQARGMPVVVASRYRPVWAAMMLGISPCEARSGALEDQGIDDRIGALAGELGKPVRSLEDVLATMTLMDDLPLARQLDMIRMFLNWPGNPDDMGHTLREAYLAEKTGLIWAYGTWLAEKEGQRADMDLFEDRLLIRRNRAWVDLLTAEPDNQRILVAVGAAHLPGDNGVLNLLAQAGFTVTRLPFRP